MNEIASQANRSDTASYQTQSYDFPYKNKETNPDLLGDFEANEILLDNSNKTAANLQNTRDNIFDNNSTSELFTTYTKSLTKIGKTLKTQTNLQPDLYLAGTFTDFGPMKSVNVALVSTDSGLPQANVPALFSANVFPNVSPVADVKVYRLSDNSFEPGFSIPTLANQITLAAQTSARALGMPSSITNNLIGFANVRYNFTSGKASLNSGLFIKAEKNENSNTDTLQSKTQKKILGKEMFKNNAEEISRTLFGDTVTNTAQVIDKITDFAKINPASLGIKKTIKTIASQALENKIVNSIANNTVGIVGIGERNIEIQINFDKNASNEEILASFGIDENTDINELGLNIDENVEALAVVKEEFEKENQGTNSTSSKSSDWQNYNEFASQQMSKSEFESRSLYMATEKLDWTD